ncbi:hypothetical protein GOY13_02360 [Wolbachia endosymbiont of Cruorifilaria tuberocauda]|uniref:hypothetical protein n=1 Tax=Wolbachia endosymbiont of Cruorifilaria tuberocauda TaxID=1812111 RepID=UPI00158A83C1|nr:hypothetical protein [Wolbachia endosymbiont of Cruorifilaria tuberocauda]QKX01763.1 hypothetical protein GOY13_02360 [Wolbachia endosymbiont of Cruorifilaria tuberocauda]
MRSNLKKKLRRKFFLLIIILVNASFLLFLFIRGASDISGQAVVKEINIRTSDAK